MLWKHTAYRHGRFKLHFPPNDPNSVASLPPNITNSEVSKPGSSPRVETPIVGVFDPVRDGYIRDHVINGVVALPGAAFVTTALQLAAKLSVKANAVMDIRFERFCEWLKVSEPLALNATFDGRNFAFEQRGTKLSRGAVVERRMPNPIDSAGITAIWDRVTASTTKLNMARVYPALATHSGIAFGSTFRRLSEVYKLDTDLIALVAPFSEVFLTLPLTLTPTQPRVAMTLCSC
jgi:hypothetical protein